MFLTVLKAISLCCWKESILSTYFLPENDDFYVGRRIKLWSCYDHGVVEGTERSFSNVRNSCWRRTSGRWLGPPLVFRQQPYLSSSTPRPPSQPLKGCEGQVGMRGEGLFQLLLLFSMTSAGPSRHLGWRRTNDRSFWSEQENDYYFIQMVVRGGWDDVIARSWWRPCVRVYVPLTIGLSRS